MSVKAISIFCHCNLYAAECFCTSFCAYTFEFLQSSDLPWFSCDDIHRKKYLLDTQGKTEDDLFHIFFSVLSLLYCIFLIILS